LVDGLQEGRCVLGSDSAHYVTRVHRLRVGAEVVLFDPKAGTEAPAELVSVGKEVAVVVGQVVCGARRGLPQLELVWGIGKGDKVEEVVRSAVALGAGKLWIVETQRSVPRVQHMSARKRERWQGVADDVMRQCERSDRMALLGPLPWLDVLEQSADALRIVLHPDASAPALLERLKAHRQGAAERQSVQLWIGPEGGFDDAELSTLVERGGVLADLGPLILRTEIAVDVALALGAAVLRTA
jgi:16S rRNA (uracil1498-N3)-methyltransferase